MSRSLGSACDGVIAVVVPITITRSQVVTAGIPTGRAENDEDSTIPQVLLIAMMMIFITLLGIVAWRMLDELST